jgi:Mor family transcriptional regulator
MTARDRKTPDLIAFLQDTVKAILEGRQIPFDQAEEIAVQIADQVSFEWGGAMIYIPRSVANLLTRRNEKILAEFNGANHVELSRKYKVSVQWIYSLLRKHSSRK